MKNKIINALIGTGRKGMPELIAYMESQGFFDAPCSSKFHLARVGGLAEHSMNVYKVMKELAESLTVGSEITDESIIICALLHDLGKMGDRDKSMYVENILKSTGKASAAEPYKVSKELMNIPHEIRSVIIAERFIGLTEDEEFAILYHNGLYGDLKYQINGKETSLYLLLHFADMWCSRITEIGGDAE